MTNATAIPEAGRAQGAGPRDRLFTNPTFHFETLRNARCIVSNCDNLGEFLATTKVLDEGDAQSWYTAWKATADLALALAERTQDSLEKSGT